MAAEVTHELPTLGVRLPNSGPFATADAIVATAELAEHLGYERVWVHDHISWPREKLTHFATGSLEACQGQDPNFLESVSTTAALTGRLRRTGVGVAGLILPIRDPRLLAKQLATVDHFAAAPLVVAVAIGAIRGDFEVMGVAFERRGKISNDYLAALTRILRGEQPASYDGEFVAFTDGTFLPRPEGLRLWVTGSSQPGLRRAARFADGWMTVYQTVEAYGAFVGQLSDLASELGRAPVEMATGYETYVAIADTDTQAISTARRSLEGKFETLGVGLEVCIVGGPETFRARLAAYKAAGAGHIELKFIAHDLSQLHDEMRSVAEIAGLSQAMVVS